MQMPETRVQPLGREDPLEEEMAAHSSILAWKIPWTAQPGRLPSLGLQRAGHDRAHTQNRMQICSLISFLLMQQCFIITIFLENTPDQYIENFAA